MRIYDLYGKDFVVVVIQEYRWRRYGKNAIIESQQVCNSMDEALRVRASFERNDNQSYIIKRKEDIYPEYHRNIMKEIMKGKFIL